MSDTSTKVVIDVSADTTKAVSELNKLLASQKKINDEANKGSFEKFLDKAATGLAKFNLAVGGLQKAWSLAGDAMELATKADRWRVIEKNLPTGAIEKLQQATGGLIAKTDLLTLASKGMTGAFKLSGEQMGFVVKTALALERQGRGTAEELGAKLVDSLHKGGKGLDDLGIKIDETKTGAARAKDVWEQFQKVQANTAPMDAQSRALKQSQVALKDLGDEVVRFAGDAANAFLEFISVTRSPKIVDDTRAGFLNFIGGVVGGGSLGNLAQDAEEREAAAKAQQEAEYKKLNPGRFVRSAPTVPNAPPPPTDIGGRSSSPVGGGGRKKQKYQYPGDYYTMALQSEIGGYGPDAFQFDATGSTTMSGRQSLFGPWQEHLDPFYANERSRASMDEPYAGIPLDKRPKKKNWLGQSGDGQDMAMAGLNGIGEGFVNSIAAVTEGTASFSGAIKMMEKAVLGAVKTQAMAKAKFEVAEGIASLAVGNWAGAGQHAAAAAAYAAAAGLAGALAGGGGGGGGGGHSAPAGGGFSTGSRGSSSSGGDSITVIVQGDAGDPHALAEKVSKRIADAKKAGRVRGTDGPTAFV